MGKQLTVAFIGNPNCGKTTLFNAYTGANLKVANWPGVTVERVEGVMKDHGVEMRLVDLPGTLPPIPWRNRCPGISSSLTRWMLLWTWWMPRLWSGAFI